MSLGCRFWLELVTVRGVAYVSKAKLPLLMSPKSRSLLRQHWRNCTVSCCTETYSRYDNQRCRKDCWVGSTFGVEFWEGTIARTQKGAWFRKRFEIKHRNLWVLLYLEPTVQYVLYHIKYSSDSEDKWKFESPNLPDALPLAIMSEAWNASWRPRPLWPIVGEGATF